jgi:MFS family permease
MLRKDKTSTTTDTALLWPILLCSLPLYILSFLLPIYAQRLGASAADIGGLFFLFAIVIVLIRPLVGVAMDRFGRKRFFILGLLCYVVAMGLFAAATDITVLYLARLFQGIGAALTWIASYTIAAELAITGRRGESLGQVDGASDRGAFCGAVLALAPLGWMSLRFGWRILFLSYAVFAVMGVYLAWRRVPETRAHRLSVRPSGETRAWSVLRLLRMVASSDSSSGPLSGPLWRLLGVAFVTKASWALIGPLLLIFLQSKFTTDIWQLALAYVPATLILGLLPGRMGRLSDRMGRMPLIAFGLAWSGLISFFLPGLPTLGWFMVFFALNAFGIVMTMPAQKALVGDLSRREDWGKAFGLYTFAGSMGSAVGPLLGGWLYDTFAPTTPFYVNGALLLGNAVWVVLLFGRHASGRTAVSGLEGQGATGAPQSNEAAAESSIGETSNS